MMANIYEEKTEGLHQLLDRARADDGATVLIPDLQRPYVWAPNQVSLLVDSLIRGWPFGTLLLPAHAARYDPGDVVSPAAVRWTRTNKATQAPRDAAKKGGK